MCRRMVYGKRMGCRMYMKNNPFMYTDVQMKYVSKLTDARRASSGRWLFPTRFEMVKEEITVLKRVDLRMK